MDGKSGPLGGPADKLAFSTMRSLCDVVLVGAGTARAENYGSVKIAGRSPDEQPPLALISRSLDVSPDARFFTEPGPRPLIITTAAAAAPDWLRERADFVIAGQDHVDLSAALDQLAARGLAGVLCEGGPRLFADLARANLVDELCLTVAPLLAGPGRAGILGGPAWQLPVTLTLRSAVAADDVLLLRYGVTREVRPSLSG
jgi:riboflavin biosynthesis pyrimidine reductase